jgi:hypothetical protein
MLPRDIEMLINKTIIKLEFRRYYFS